jgi:hypothetical protein
LGQVPRRFLIGLSVTLQVRDVVRKERQGSYADPPPFRGQKSSVDRKSGYDETNTAKAEGREKKREK